MPQFIQAKRKGNKLGVEDNRPYAIDKVRFIDGGFLLFLVSDVGEEKYLSYSSLDWFREDFSIVNNIRDIEEYKELK